MSSLYNSIALIGFKHVGKSVIGKSLAEKLSMSFIDLDLKIEDLYENEFNEKTTCRQIMQAQGEKFFRALESRALTQVIHLPSSVVSLGGGTPLSLENQDSIKSSLIVYITAPKEKVFERICMGGLPAFLNSENDFQRLWDERTKIYEKINHFSIDNNGTVDQAVNKIIEKLTVHA